MTLVVIPTTILLTLFAAKVMGYTINRVSLFALIFSIGILVDDAIVVVENIARHWAMNDGRSRLSAAIEAVAEVGNPTMVATLTVVAALLPMLFVSGLMGPYMAPIPANASAAMLFSFFVAVIIAPWLMLRLAPRAVTGGGARHGEGWLGRRYRQIARPVIQTRRSAWIFLIAVGMATLLVMLLFVTKAVTVKLLPFDNKSEIAVVVDLPEGASLEDTERLLLAAAEIARRMPEVQSIQAYAGTPAPFNFNGLVRHYYLRQAPELGELQVNLAPRSRRGRASHAIALDLREWLKALAPPAGTSSRWSRFRPALPCLQPCWPKSTDRTDDPARRPRRSQEGLYLRALHRRCRRLDRPAAAAPAPVDRSGSPGILRRRAKGRLRHDPDAAGRHSGRLFSSR